MNSTFFRSYLLSLRQNVVLSMPRWCIHKLCRPCRLIQDVGRFVRALFCNQIDFNIIANLVAFVCENLYFVSGAPVAGRTAAKCVVLRTKWIVKHKSSKVAFFALSFSHSTTLSSTAERMLLSKASI